MPEYYSLEEVASRLGKTEEEVKDLVGQGKLRAFRDAGTLKFRRADIDTVAPAPAGKAEGKPAGDKSAMTPEPDQDELLFLIDEEGTPGESDDLTLIGEEDQAALEGEAGDQGEGVEVAAEPGEGEVDDEALTAVMPAPGAPRKAVVETPAPDIFAEAQSEMGAVQEVEAEPIGATVGLPASRAMRLQQMQAAQRTRNPFMSVLLVLTFLVVLFGGVIVYNSVFVDPKPAYIVSLLQSVKTQ